MALYSFPKFRIIFKCFAQNTIKRIKRRVKRMRMKDFISTEIRDASENEQRTPNFERGEDKNENITK